MDGKAGISSMPHCIPPFLAFQKTAGAHAIHGSRVHGQDDGAPERELIQEVGDSVALPVAEGGHRGQDGRNVFRRVHPGQRQQAADAEGQLEGRFPFSGGSCGNDDSVVLGDLAQAGDRNSRLMIMMVTQNGHSPAAVR